MWARVFTQPLNPSARAPPRSKGSFGSEGSFGFQGFGFGGMADGQPEPEPYPEWRTAADMQRMGMQLRPTPTAPDYFARPKPPAPDFFARPKPPAPVRPPWFHAGPPPTRPKPPPPAARLLDVTAPDPVLLPCDLEFSRSSPGRRDRRITVTTSIIQPKDSWPEERRIFIREFAKMMNPSPRRLPVRFLARLQVRTARRAGCTVCKLQYCIARLYCTVLYSTPFS